MSKLIRIETGDVRISTNDLRALLAFYRVPPERVTALVEVARAAREPVRWARYRDVASPQFLAFLGYESSASIIRNFEPILVPGLLQTEEYARAVLSQVAPLPSVDSLVDLRVERQELLVGEPRPELHFVVDEAVVRHVVGGPDVMRRQLAHLRDLTSRLQIDLRILGFEVGMYPRMRLPFVVFEFEAPEDEDVLYVESDVEQVVIMEGSPQGGVQPGPVEYLGSFLELEQLASQEDTSRLIDAALERVSRKT